MHLFIIKNIFYNIISQNIKYIYIYINLNYIISLCLYNVGIYTYMLYVTIVIY